MVDREGNAVVGSERELGSSELVRRHFRRSAEWFGLLVSAVQAWEWELRCRGEKSLLDIVAQGTRPLTTTRDFLGAPERGIRLNGTLDYYLKPRGGADPAGAEGIRLRELAAGRLVRDGDVVETVMALCREVIGIVGAAEDGATVATQNGDIALIQYLPTRTLEIVGCSLEIAEVIGASVALDSELLRASAELSWKVNMARGREADVCRVLWSKVQQAPGGGGKDARAR